MDHAPRFLALGLLLGLVLAGCGDSPVVSEPCRTPAHINVLAAVIMANGHHWCRSFYPINNYEGMDQVWIRKDDHGGYTLLFDLAHRGRFSGKKYCSRIKFTITKDLVCRKAVVVEETTPFSSQVLWTYIDLAIGAFEELTPSYLKKIGLAIPSYKGPVCSDPN